jgi:hypothetical protein
MLNNLLLPERLNKGRLLFNFIALGVERSWKNWSGEQVQLSPSS